MNSKIIFLLFLIISCSAKSQEQSNDLKTVDGLQYSIKILNKEFVLENPQEEKILISPFKTDKIDQKCNQFILKSTSYKTENKKIETNEKISYFVRNDKLRYSGIGPIYLFDNKLTININQFQGYDKYESFTNKIITKNIYQGDPVTAGAINIITLGIPIILAPKKNYEMAFGCTDEFVSNRQIDRSRPEKKILETVWRKSAFSHSFKIEGPDFIFDSDDNDDKKLFTQNHNPFEIDLTSKIKYSSNPKITELNIVCKSCDTLSENHQTILGAASVEKKIVGKLTYIKSQAEIAQDLKIEKLNREFDEKIATNEGLYCAKKLNVTAINDDFFACYETELKISDSRKKFLKAIATKEGELCSRKSKIDNANFWSCHEKNVAETNAKKVAEELKLAEQKKFSNALLSNEGSLCYKKFKVNNASFWNCFDKNLDESMAKLKEQEEIKNKDQLKKIELANLLRRDDIARQCVEIGFEVDSATYKDCYLKLKLHSEQIAEWQKLRIALQNQVSQTTPNRQLDVRPGNSVTPEVNYEQAAALLGIAQSGLDFAAGRNRPAPMLLPPPPPPMQIITPRGNSYNCSMVGAAMRCR
jgi:hypothetical protein